MEAAERTERIYEFGSFRLVPSEGLLLESGEPVDLNPKAFAVLTLLVERNGHVVSKSEIMQKIWDEAFVEEAAVAKAIWFARNALGNGSKEMFIQTVPKRGYRFVAQVRSRNDLTNTDSSTNLSTGYRLPAAPKAVDAAFDRRSNSTVLPSNLFFPNKLFRYAAYIGIILFAVIALYAAYNWRYFAKNYGSRDRGTKNEEAYQLYQQAQSLSSGRLPDKLLAALDYLNQAVTLDPEFARAWAAKAHLHRDLANGFGGDQAEQYRKSMDAVGKALAIDPNISEAYSALCLNKLHYDFDMAGAEKDCKHALELDPDSAVGHKSYARFLSSRGRPDEAIAEVKLAMDLQPLSDHFKQNYALALYFARRHEEEEVQWEQLLELNPTRSFIYRRLSINQALQGKEDKAFDHFVRKLALDNVGSETVEQFRKAFAESGWLGVTRERIKHPELESFSGPFDFACLYATVGDRDKAFEYLEKAYQERNYRLAMLRVEPLLDPLRADPRFEDLLRRVEH